MPAIRGQHNQGRSERNTLMIIISDLHTGNKHDTIKKGWTDNRSFDLLARGKEAIDAARRLKSSAMAIAGDIYQSSKPEPDSIDILFRLLSYAQEQDIFVYIIPGNHDWSLKYNSLIYMNARLIRGIRVILKPTIVTIENSTVAFLPHVSPREYASYDSYMDYAKKLTQKDKPKSKPIDLVIGHGLLEGAVDANDNSDIESGNAIKFKMSEFWNYRMGVFGHVHKAQNIGKNWYTGPVVTNTFGEVDKKYYIETKQDHTVQLVPFKTSEEIYKTFNINVFEKFKLNEQKVAIAAKNKLIRLNIATDDLNIVPKQEIEDMFNKYGTVMQLNIEVKRKDNGPQELNDIECANIIKKSDYGSIFKKYVKSKKLLKSESDLVIKLGTSLIRECTSNKGK
jgi:DNA repair exonuclease SbcCD nuclease subunit